MAFNRATLKRRWNADLKRYERAQEDLVRLLRDVIDDLGADFEVRPVPFVSGELKEFDSFYDKACRFRDKGRVSSTGECFDKINDVARARIICQTLKDANALSRLIDDSNDFLIVKETEVHGDDNVRGYRGIHLDVEIGPIIGGREIATRAEIQIQTALQFAWGLYTHKDFYKGDAVPALVGDLMVELSDLLNVADRVAQRLITAVEDGS